MPRAGLNRDKVIAEAAAVVDETGWEKLTLAAVAERVGVRLPSLYKHVESLDALRQGVAALATRQLADKITSAAVGKSRSKALFAIAEAYRKYACTHPGRYSATIRAPEPNDEAHLAAADAILQVVFAVLGGYGISGEDAVDVTRALRASLHGFVTLDAAGGFGMPRDIDNSFNRMLITFDEALIANKARTA